VLVNFFATWCVPCRQEHPELVRFAEAHRGTGDAEVVSVIYDDSPDAVRAFHAAQGGDWPMVSDPKGRIALDFGVAGVPESYLISPTGIVAAKVVGGVVAGDLERLLVQARQNTSREGSRS
jgi:cytochrome c biogenesis protein CcmG/thiol:disulfide interchange protein DsbE